MNLIPFPQRRNIGKARHVASMWLRKPFARDRDAYWNVISKAFIRTMRRIGFEDDVIQAELGDLSDAINEQIALMDRDHAFEEAHRIIAGWEEGRGDRT